MTSIKEKPTEKKTETVSTASAEELARLITMFQSLPPETQKCVNFFIHGMLMAKNT